MKHQVITLPEHHEQYPNLWQSECGSYRIIRCCDDIQYIFQEWRQPKWRSLSYHIEYDSLLRRWGDLINALPTEKIRKPNVISSKASGICTLGLQYVEH